MKATTPKMIRLKKPKPLGTMVVPKFGSMQPTSNTFKLKKGGSATKKAKGGLAIIIAIGKKPKMKGK